MITLATISPCFNEEEVLPDSVQRLSTLFDRLISQGVISKESRMVFVNDGSSDSSWDIITHLHNANKHVCGINLTTNRGHQCALLAGLTTAVDWADAFITIDADLQDDLEAIPQMIEHFEKGAEVVYGVKVQREADPLLKRMSAEAFYRLQRAMGVESIFNHADFRLLSKDAVKMLTQYEERNIYLRGIIPMLGLPSATVDDVISERSAGQSKYNLGRMLALAIDGITSFSVKPMYGVIYLGLVFLVIALLIGINVVWSLITGVAVHGWSSLILSVWIVGAFMLICMGIMGLYIGRIYQEVKRRPLYHIAKILV